MHRRAFAAALVLGAVFGGSAAEAGPARVVLVRHAEKAGAPADDPGLSTAGAVRALALEAALRETRVDAVLTTPFRRTLETAAPLLSRRQLAGTVVPVDGDHVAAVLAQLQALPAGSTVLVVGHSNTLAAIIRGLGGPALPDLRECQFDRLYVLEMNRPVGLIQARYGEPDTGCD